MILLQLDVEKLTVPQILSLLELTQGIAPHRPDWNTLKKELSQFQLLGFLHQDHIIGYALVNQYCPLFPHSVQLMALKYHWQYNHEEEIAHMIGALAEVYQSAAKQMVMDVIPKEEINCELFKKLGFRESLLYSPQSRNHRILTADLDSLAKHGFNT